MIKGKSRRQWNSPVRVGIGLTVLGALTAFGLILTACSPAAAPASPTAAKVATEPVATTGAVVAPTILAPTATALAATAEAIGTRTAPTVSAAATALAPTAAAAATSAALSAGTATTITAGQLSDAGQAVYAASCAACHGAQGQGGIGPALIGPNANFGAFRSAQDLLTFTTFTMPKTHPGSLSSEQYMDVTAYLLVQDGFAQRNASLSSAGFGTIQLKK